MRRIHEKNTIPQKSLLEEIPRCVRPTQAESCLRGIPLGCVSNALKIVQPDLTPGPFPIMEGERFVSPRGLISNPMDSRIVIYWV